MYKRTKFQLAITCSSSDISIFIHTLYETDDYNMHTPSSHHLSVNLVHQMHRSPQYLFSSNLQTEKESSLFERTVYGEAEENVRFQESKQHTYIGVLRP